MIRKILLMLLALNLTQNIRSQSSSALNTYAAGRFLGWTNTNGTNPLLFQTNGLNRMKLNATVSYGINGYPASQKNGYMLIGIPNNSIFTPANNIYTTNTAGAYSLLHLNGSVNSAVAGLNQYQEFGYRPWMETGLSLTGNIDYS